MAPRYRFFDHTGDFGADLEVGSEAEVLEASADALVALLTDTEGAVTATQTRALAVEGVDTADLMVALGNELLFLFEVDGWLAARVEVSTLEEGRLVAVGHGEPFDPERHTIARPIKAVTHHGATVEPMPDGTWRGRLVFDL